MMHGAEFGDDGLVGSARNPLIPKSQVLDVLKNLNIKEGIFTEDELKQLENGYSVSETDGEDDGGLSLRSGQSNQFGVRSVQSPMTDLYGRATAGLHSGFNNDVLMHHQSHALLDEQRVRMTQERSMLHAEIATQKSKYLKRMTNLERMLDQLKQEKRELQTVIETQKQNHKLEIMSKDQRYQDQFRELRDQQYKLQGQVPQFKEKMELYKKEFTQATLLVGEESYVEIKAKPEEQRSLKEFIQVKVYEQVDKFRAEIDALRQENDELAEQNMALKMKSERENREIDSLKKLSREREEDFRRKSDALERRVKELEHDVHRTDTQNRVLLDKTHSSKEVDDAFRQLDIEYRALKNQHKLLEDQMARLQDQKLEVERRSDSLRREIDILNSDKTFLTRENVGLEERLKRVEDKLDRTESELVEQKRIANKYMERVLSTSDDVKSKFEQQYTSELNDLKERHARELDLAKQHLTDLYERRLDHSKEQKEYFESRYLRVEQDLADKSRSYEELLVEHRQLQRSADEDLGRLKLAVSSKQDEVTRVRHLYEDNLSLVKELKVENEALKSKVEVLKTEYYKLEGMNRQGTAEIRAELAVCKERLANYELIEKELDQAIMNVANNDNLDAAQNDSIGNALIQTITSAPTTAKRRIQQSLLLANRLQTKQKENEALLQEINILKEKLESAEGEVKFKNRMLDKTNQPHTYLMQDVEKLERELQFANKKIKKAEDEIKRLAKENEALNVQKRGLSDDLQKLLAKRQQIENLQITLQGIIQSSHAKKIDVDELKHKLADSIRSGSYQSQSASFKENVMKKFNKSRSKSPKHFMASYDEIPERGSAVKMSQDSKEPQWYKILKQKQAK